MQKKKVTEGECAQMSNYILDYLKNLSKQGKRRVIDFVMFELEYNGK